MNLQDFGLGNLIDTIVTVVREPTSNLTAAVLLLAAITIALLILVLLALAAIMRPSKQERVVEAPSAEESARAAASGRRKREIIAVGSILGVVLGLGIAYSQIASTSACLGCHASSSDVATSWSEGAHAGVQCWDCHGGGTIANGLVARIDYVRWARSPVDPAAPTRRASVASSACLKCHDEILGETVETENLRMSHVEPQEAGYLCTDCHEATAHAVLVERTGSRMAVCLDCHDDKIAPAACSGCHVTDVSRTAGTPPERFPKVELGPPQDCRGCHSIEACNECHGLELPHSQEFATTGAHAKEAAFEKQQVCAKCHDIQKFCNRCHDFWQGHSGTDWQVEHGPRAARLGREKCTPCHKRSKDFCALCHD